MASRSTPPSIDTKSRSIRNIPLKLNERKTGQKLLKSNN
jgi:hypothetical protein